MILFLVKFWGEGYVMAKKSGRGRGRGRGTLKGTIGKTNPPVEVSIENPVNDDLVESECFADADFPDGQEGQCDPDSVLDQVDHKEFQGCDTLSIAISEHTEIGHETISAYDESDCDGELPNLNCAETMTKDLGPDVAKFDGSNGADWHGLFSSERTLGNLQFFVSKKFGAKVSAVEEGISKWHSCLVGQVLDKPLPFFLVKKAVTCMWKQCGNLEVFSLENGMFMFRFQDEVTCDEVLDSKLWHIANKPLILRKWRPCMQVLKLTLSTVPIWIKLVHLPLEFWNPMCLSHMASGVGKPLYADKITEE
jgi:hypothetical protein